MSEPSSPGDIILTGDLFRKSRRALLTVATTAIIFAVANVGPYFEPEVLGHSVRIPAGLIDFGLFLFLGDLWVGFEHERARLGFVYSQRVFTPGKLVEGLTQAIDTLKADVENLSLRATAVAEDLLQVEQQRAQIQEIDFPFTYLPSQVTGLNEVTTRVEKLLQGVLETNLQLVPGRVAEVVSGLHDVLAGARHQISADVEKTWAMELGNLRNRLKERIAIQTDEREKMAARFGAATRVSERIAELTAEIGSLSRSLSIGERRIFAIRETWATRVVAGVALAAIAADAGHLVFGWSIPLFVE